MSEIRALLNEWDAIGIAGPTTVDDEYDCMIGPLFSQLQAGSDTASLHGWIARERHDHFGLPPDTDADAALAASLVAWWERPREVAP